MGVYIGAVKDDYSALQGPAPSGFHVPLTTEWQAVYDIWTALGGGSDDGTNFGIALKLPLAGHRIYMSAAVSNQGSLGLYWSSSRSSTDYAYYLGFSSTSLAPQDTGPRTSGFSIRCFKNSPAVPTSSWTKLYGTSIEAGGIFWSSTDGLISLSSDGQTWVTIADKNLGANTVWNSGDTLSGANAGKYYQRGNNYGFPFTGSVTTSSTQVDASTYGPGNYYSSDTFITRGSSPYRWDTTDNGNLWGGVTGVMPTSLKNAYIGGLYKYSYDFKNKTISGFAADGWTYDDTKVPSFDSNGIYYTEMTTTTSSGIELNYDLTSAKKITLITSFVIANSTTHLGAWGIGPSNGTSSLSGIFLTNMLGAHTQDIRIGGSTVSTTNVSVSTGTYTETIEYNLINKTYTYSGCYPTSGSLTDAQISLIKNNDGVMVAVGGNSGIKISTIDLTIEY